MMTFEELQLVYAYGRLYNSTCVLRRKSSEIPFNTASWSLAHRIRKQIRIVQRLQLKTETEVIEAEIFENWSTQIENRIKYLRLSDDT